MRNCLPPSLVSVTNDLGGRLQSTPSPVSRVTAGPEGRLPWGTVSSRHDPAVCLSGFCSCQGHVPAPTVPSQGRAKARRGGASGRRRAQEPGD